MRRLWIGLGLLLGLLAIGLGLLVFSEGFFREFSANLEEAARLSMAEDWPAAVEKAEKSRAMWQRYYRFFSATTDHEPIEEVQELFARLELYSRERIAVDFSAVCRSLSKLAEAINESHNLRWWSIL